MTFYQEFFAHKCLSPWIDRFWVLYSDTKYKQKVCTMLPSQCPTLVISDTNFSISRKKKGESLFRGKVALLGIQTRPLYIKIDNGLNWVGAKVHPTAMHGMCNIKPRFLIDEILEPYKLTSQGLERSISEGECFDLRLNQLQSQLITLFEGHSIKQKERRLLQILKSIHERNGNFRVGDLAINEGLSTKSLQRIFSGELGISPKSYSMITRFESFARYRFYHQNQSITECAIACGYYDEAHVYKEAKKILSINCLDFFHSDTMNSDFIHRYVQQS